MWQTYRGLKGAGLRMSRFCSTHAPGAEHLAAPETLGCDLVAKFGNGCTMRPFGSCRSSPDGLSLLLQRPPPRRMRLSAKALAPHAQARHNTAQMSAPQHFPSLRKALPSKALQKAHGLVAPLLSGAPVPHLAAFQRRWPGGAHHAWGGGFRVWGFGFRVEG